jgi:hypothetical protein
MMALLLIPWSMITVINAELWGYIYEATYGALQAIFGAATRRWLAGVCSPAQARFEIRAGCRLLDLPESAVEEDSLLAGPSG